MRADDLGHANAGTARNRTEPANGIMQRLSNRDVLLRLRDGMPLRASRTYVEGLMQALRLNTLE